MELFGCCSCWAWSAVAIGVLYVVWELYAKATEKSVAGKRVLITGAGSGIGRLLALRFAREGGELFLWDLNEEGLEETKRQALDAGAKSVAIATVDVSDPARVQEAAACVPLQNSLEYVMREANHASYDCILLAAVAEMWAISTSSSTMLESCRGSVSWTFRRNGS